MKWRCAFSIAPVGQSVISLSVWNSISLSWIVMGHLCLVVLWCFFCPDAHYVHLKIFVLESWSWIMHLITRVSFLIFSLIIFLLFVYSRAATASPDAWFIEGRDYDAFVPRGFGDMWEFSKSRGTQRRRRAGKRVCITVWHFTWKHFIISKTPSGIKWKSFCRMLTVENSVQQYEIDLTFNVQTWKTLI